MNNAKLSKLKKELARLLNKRGAVTTGELEQFAKKLGRRKLTGSQVRGKEPAWVSDELPDARPISIPFHGKNATSAPKTIKNILYDLEGDIAELEMKYARESEHDYE